MQRRHPPIHKMVNSLFGGCPQHRPVFANSLRGPDSGSFQARQLFCTELPRALRPRSSTAKAVELALRTKDQGRTPVTHLNRGLAPRQALSKNIREHWLSLVCETCPIVAATPLSVCNIPTISLPIASCRFPPYAAQVLTRC